MKNFILSLFVLASISAFGQSPQKMSYQAVVRDATNQLLANGSVGVKISILEGSASGTVVYSETHTPTTNDNGLFSIEIGNGSVVSGDFSLIPWATDSFWLKSEVDLDGGTNYTLSTVSQFLSVPYSLNSTYAETSGNGIDAITDNGDGTLTVEFLNGTNYTTPVLSGIQGDAGQDGLSAYEIWLNAGNTGTEADFINFLKGAPGTNGVSVANSYIQNDSLRLELSNGQTINAGYLAGVSITNTVIQNDSLIVSLSNGQTINAGYLNCPGQNAFLPAVTTNTTTPKVQSVEVEYIITNDGNELILASGICVSATPNPTVSDRRLATSSSVDTDPFTLKIAKLLPNTQYYTRSFATNPKGTAYGNEISFTTLPACEAAGTYNCSIFMIKTSSGTPYSSTTNGTLTINSDLTFEFSFTDPSAPFACNMGLIIHGTLDCDNNNIVYNYVEETISGCSVFYTGAGGQSSFNAATDALNVQVSINSVNYSFNLSY